MSPHHQPSATRLRPAAPTRRDSLITYRRLVEAAGRLLDRHEHQGFNLAEVAREAEVSTATVYRYFGSIDHLVDAYLDAFVDDLAVARARRPEAERTGVAGLRTLGDDYVELALSRGRAMVHGRSLAGIVHRYRAGDPSIVKIWALYAEPIGSALDELGHGPDDLEFAVLLWNAMFYARELLDLRESMGWSPQTISRRLTDTFLGAMGARTAAPNAASA
ncbi:TetR/AcrR family transcriptional regulator [Baekduia soli]|uniref:TetR/AcrR family transcriptional regulator n=1 Tax=Baekduia soli TaxID=496014 RepID=UPI001651B1E3|nr:TetR/AcrR family transcriptional regulator [Baekduia soli]